MADPDAASRLGRLVRAFDPARPGFVRRMVRVAVATAVLLLCVLLAVAARWAWTPDGRYWTAVALVEAGAHGLAARVAESLVAEHPTHSYMDYRVLAAAYRRDGRHAEQMATFDAAVAAFPDDWRAHGHRCWYGTLFGDPVDVMGSCDRAAALVPDDEAFPYSWRAAARSLTGDREGAIADLEVLIARWEAHGDRRGYYWRTRTAWLEALRAGEDPFDAEGLARLRDEF